MATESGDLPVLTKLEKRFVLAYVANGGNATAALREANPNTVNWQDTSVTVKASQYGRSPKIRAHIAALEAKAIKATTITRARILTEVARVALFDPRQLFDDTGAMLLPAQWPAEVAAAVASIEVVELPAKDGAIPLQLKKVRFVSKDGALDKLMKHLGLYEQDHAQQNPVIANLEALPLEAQQLLAARLEQRLGPKDVAGEVVNQGEGGEDNG